MALGPVLATLTPTLINVRGRPAESGKETEMTKRKLFEYGGIAAGVILIAFGAASLVMSINGRNTVQDSLKQEAIVGSPDMTPDAIAKEAKEAGLPASIDIRRPATSPTSPSRPGKTRRCFSQYMRIHALESIGRTHLRADGRFANATDDGKGQTTRTQATRDPEPGQPVSNARRDLWVTETALTTALNVKLHGRPARQLRPCRRNRAHHLRHRLPRPRDRRRAQACSRERAEERRATAHAGGCTEVDRYKRGPGEMPGPRSWAGGAGRRRCGTLTGMADVKEAREALSDVELEPLDRYWRAANYLSVGQIYLLDNPLLAAIPLSRDDIKPRLLGHPRHDARTQLHPRPRQPGSSRRATSTPIMVIGPGPRRSRGWSPAHGWRAAYTGALPVRLAGTRKACARLFRQFSLPCGVGSHVTPETPGLLHEGGELGYSLVHAYGASFDDPGLTVFCVVGDGEAETGPLAASWHSAKFVDPPSATAPSFLSST